jgi:hypothetical protein
MDGSVEALADDDNDERQRQERQSREMSQPHVTRKEIAHVRAEDARKTERRPISRTERWQVNSLHRDFLLSDGKRAAGNPSNMKMA